MAITINCRGRKFHQIEAVIFDKDGTLQDSQDYLRELGQKRARLIDARVPGTLDPLLMAFGIHNGKLDPTGLMAVGSHRENEIAAAAYIAETGKSWFEAKAIATQAFTQALDYIQNRADTSPLFAGSLEVLKFLSQAGLKLGILSADTTFGVKDFVDRHQLSSYIQLTMGVETGPTKPDPALFLLACQKLKIEPQFALMVGDSRGDIEMSKSAGAAGSIGICWGNPEAAHLEMADVTISHLDEIQILEVS